MNQKPLGKSGSKISEIGQGTWAYHSGVEALRTGISLGATHVDTAEMYGTEGKVGEAIADRRDAVFLATKVSPQHLHYEDVLRAAEGSLSRLNVKTVDLYMIHWPNSRIPIQETMKAMEELVNKGKIRYIGVSNFSVEELKDAQEAMSSHEIVSNQVQYNLENRDAEKELIPYCKTEKITLVPYSPLSRGAVTRKEDAVLEKIGTKYKKTKAQVVLNFLTREEYVVAIPKSDDISHVKENCEASGWRLSNEDIRMIDEKF
ncbi:MAG: aldo/keto reductase [Thaumarchaeota archaeon]|nr:aldo/keto reductase [Nitrososphaerota archaeon]